VLAAVLCLVGCVGRTPEGLYKSAEASYQHGDLDTAGLAADAGYRRFFISMPEWAGRFQLLRIRVMLERGKFQDALEELGKSPGTIFATCELQVRRHLLEASLYYDLVKDPDVVVSMQQAKQPCIATDPMLAADAATAQANVMDDRETAERDYRRALELARREADSFREAGALANLSYATLNLERYDESIAWAKASLQISQKMGYRIYEEKAEGNLAYDFDHLGNFGEASTLGRNALHSARVLDAYSDQILWLNEIGRIDEESGKFEEARDEYKRALAMAEQQKDKFQSSIALSALAFLSVRTGQWNDAEMYSRQALELAREEQDHPIELQALFVQGLIASHRGEMATAEKLLNSVASDEGHDRRSLVWASQAALAGIYATEKKARPADAEYRLALETIRQARCNIQQQDLRLPFFANSTSVYDSYIDFLVNQGKALEALKIADESRALTLAEGMGVDGRKCLAAEDNFDPLRVAKKADATVLFYWLGGDRSYLWAIGSSRVKLFPLPPKSEIEHEVEEYQAALPGRHDVLETADKHGEYLYTSLVAPAAEFLRKDGRVIVVADGNLSGLGFDSVIVPTPKPHYWIEDVAVENASSLRLLAESSHRQGAAGGKLLLMGDPLPAPEFPALPHAAEELSRVKANFAASSQQIYERGTATKESYLASHPEQFMYIHFVAHGTASLTDPLDSAVVLSPAGADGGYKLYARDIVTHPLNAELVTIASCTSAGKRIYKGEGLVGLSWAFLGAHAHNVIGSLWDVSDSSTSQLIDALYAELAKGRKPDVALRSAKLAMLHSQTAFQRPNYWAAFQLYTRS
jgi:CHAT domain-containing protein